METETLEKQKDGESRPLEALVIPNYERKKIYNTCCMECPINNQGPDQECRDIKKLPKEIIAKEFLFVCFKRQKKLCKGLCEYMGIDEDFLEKCYE